MARPWKFGLPSLLIALGALSACDGDDPFDPTLRLEVVSGGGQSGLAGTVAPQPLIVRAFDLGTEAPEAGVAITWTTVQGSGEPARTTSRTDENGEASTLVFFGADAGSLEIEASVGPRAVTFPALTVLPAPTIQSIIPAVADPEDTVEVRVNNLPSGLAPEVLFDGVPAEIVDQQAGAPTVLDVVVPAPVGVCAATSVSVDVRLRVGGVTSAPSAIDVNVPADPFQVGQVLVIEGTTDVQCALLPAAAGAAKYLLVALNARLETVGQFQVTLGSSSVAIAAVEGASPPRLPGFHDRLRAFEAQLAAQGLPSASSGRSGARLFAEPAVGDKRTFNVLNNVEFTLPLLASDFDEVTATLAFVGRNSLLYIDDAAPSPGLTQGDLQTLGEAYDGLLYDVDVDFFGEPTDIDEDGRVAILLSPTVNKLTERGSEGIIVGFTFLVDLVDPSEGGDFRFSNRAEIFYGLVPDEAAQFSDAITRERVRELLPSVMIHETQHMISNRYKIFENLVPQETLWLSEALAHASEELGGDAADAAGQTALADDLYGSNFGRAAAYLGAPDTSSLTVVDGNGTLGERGAGWLFLRWVAEQYGDLIMRSLTQARPNGVANVELQTGEPFFRLFADWTVALWADDQNIPGLSTRHQIPKWQLRSIFDVGDPPQYLLRPQTRTFVQFRNNQISSMLAATAPLYVELDAAGDGTDLQLELTSVTDAGLVILRFQ